MILAALSTLIIGVLIIGLIGVVVVRKLDQAWRDKNRRTYVLTFPVDISTDQVITWIYSISGTLKQGRMRLAGVPTMAFELWATPSGIVHRLRVPWQQADYIVSQLRALVPGIRVTPEEEYPEDPIWVRIREFGEQRPERSLRILSPEALSASLLASVQALKPYETVLIQWVVTPAVPQRPPQSSTSQRGGKHAPLLNGFVQTDSDAIADQRAKLAEPNMLAVLRVAASAATLTRADHLVYRVRAALASARGPHNGFVRKRLTSGSKKLNDRLYSAAAGLTFPAQLAASEFAALLAWPIGQPHVAGLAQGQARHLPATEAVPRDGRILGDSNFPGNERRIAVSVGNSCKHLHILGPTGVGKTALLSNLAAQDMARGNGLVLIESKGDLFHETLARVPRNRLQDVVVMDVTDTAHPVGFNILKGNPQVVAADIQRLFEFLYPNDVRGVRVRQGLYHAILTLMTSTNAAVPMTFADIGPLCSPRSDQVAFSDNLIRGVRHDDELAGFWQELDNLPKAQRDGFFGPLLGRIWQLNNRREVRNIIGQSESTIELGEIVRGKKILLVNLAGLGSDVASLVGSLLINSLWTHIQAGAASPKDPTFLYLDEFQDYLNLPISAEEMLAKSRSLGLAMTLAHQHLGQLGTELRTAILANARSKVVFQTSSDDARVFAREFGGQVSEHDFMHLGQYEFVGRIATDSGVSSPLTGMTKPPSKTTGIANMVRAHSRTQYSRPVADVEASIKVRRQVANVGGTGKGKLPPLGGELWR